MAIASDFDLIVFDLDGTLVDSLPDITRALNLALADYGVAALDASVVRGLVGEGVVRLADKALAFAGASAAAGPGGPATMAARIRDIYRREPVVHTRLYPGIAATLTALRASPQRRLAVLTNKPGEVTRPLLTALGLDPLLHAAIGDGDGFPRKPDPAALQALSTRFQIPLARTLMVGDGLPDLEAAHAAGCAAAAALWGYTPQEELLARNPRYVLAHASELVRE